jgi:hypothetical protein
VDDNDREETTMETVTLRLPRGLPVEVKLIEGSQYAQEIGRLVIESSEDAMGEMDDVRITLHVNEGAGPLHKTAALVSQA